MRGFFSKGLVCLLLLAGAACAELESDPADPGIYSGDGDGSIVETSVSEFENTDTAKQPTIPPGPDHQEGIPLPGYDPGRDIDDPDPSPTTLPHWDNHAL